MKNIKTTGCWVWEVIFSDDTTGECGYRTIGIYFSLKSAEQEVRSCTETLVYGRPLFTPDEIEIRKIWIAP